MGQWHKQHRGLQCGSCEYVTLSHVDLEEHFDQTGHKKAGFVKLLKELFGELGEIATSPDEHVGEGEPARKVLRCPSCGFVGQSADEVELHLMHSGHKEKKPGFLRTLLLGESQYCWVCGSRGRLPKNRWGVCENCGRRYCPRCVKGLASETEYLILTTKYCNSCDGELTIYRKPTHTQGRT